MPGHPILPSTSATLYAFGNRKYPRPPRPNIDIVVDNNLVKSTQPPTGASTFADIKYAPLTGHYYRIDKGTPLPVGLVVKNIKQYGRYITNINEVRDVQNFHIGDVIHKG